jgi:chromosome segregation ATPase
MDERGLIKCLEVIGTALDDKETRYSAAAKNEEFLALKLKEANQHLDQYAALQASLEKEITQLRSELKRSRHVAPDDYYVHRILDGWVALKATHFLDVTNEGVELPSSKDKDPVKALELFIKTKGE